LTGVTAIAAGGYHTVALKRTQLVAGDLVISGSVSATAFNTTSDRNAKEAFTAVDPQAVLAKVAALPITQWQFKGQPGEAHLGPMAQDFRAAFGLGPDERHIATVDADGVALAAIQGLNQKLETQQRDNAELRRELEALKAALHQLASPVQATTQP
jgi:trimeric autotransporter adhesin